MLQPLRRPRLWGYARFSSTTSREKGLKGVLRSVIFVPCTSSMPESATFAISSAPYHTALQKEPCSQACDARQELQSAGEVCLKGRCLSVLHPGTRSEENTRKSDHHEAIGTNGRYLRTCAEKCFVSSRALTVTQPDMEAGEQGQES